MIGTTLQNYKIEALIGEGGMGKVYKAMDTTLGRTVAIKSLNASLTNQPSFQERFKNEAKTLAKLAHPNIAVLYNYLQEGDDYYMVMEYVEGKNVDEIMHRSKPIRHEIVVPVITSVLDGLEHAHRKMVLHRDIKPANIMLTPEASIKLMDFGIAKVSDQAKLTQVSRLIGTLEFLAPELIEGNEPSPASDIYATGITMFEMLTGRLPFTGKSDYMLMQEIVKEKPVVPDNWQDIVPEALSKIILQALEKKPENRFKTAAEFANALRSAFPDLKTVPSDFVNSLVSNIAAPITHIVKDPIQQTVLQPSVKSISDPPPTTLFSQSQPTQLAEIKKKENEAPLPFYKNKLVLIGGIVLLIIVFTLFKVFSGNDEDPAESSGAIGSSSVSASEPDLVEDFSSSTKKNDSANFLFDKKKLEDSLANVQITNQTSENVRPNKKPSTQENKTIKPKPEVKPQKVEEEDNNSASESFREPISLRGGGVPVTLVLRENLTKENAHEGDRISFRVVESGLYKDEVLIPSGSVVHGTIKGIGVIRMSIIFNSITIKSRSFHLSKSEAGAGKEAVFSGKSFKSSIRGTLSP